MKNEYHLVGQFLKLYQFNSGTLFTLEQIGYRKSNEMIGHLLSNLKGEKIKRTLL